MISFLICTYNRASYLRDNLAALTVAAAGHDAEIIVVDNNSTDSTAQVCVEFPAVKYFLETVQGLSAARNRAIRESAGEVLVFLDDDAFIRSDYVVRLEEYLAGFPEVMAFGGRIDPLFESGEGPKWLGRWSRSWLSALDMGNHVRVFKSGKYPIGANMGVRRDIIKRVGLFDTALGRSGGNMIGGEEKDFFERVSAVGVEIFYFPELVVSHVIPPERTTRDYIVRFGYGVGLSELIRCGSGTKLFIRRVSELVKWGGTAVLWLAYLIGGRPAKGNALVLFRREVSRGLFGKSGE